MKKNYIDLKRTILSAVCVAALGAGAMQAQAPVTQTFAYTGAVQSFTIPSCVTSLTVTVYGAQGGNGALNGALGGAVTGVITGTAGQVFNIYIGGQPTTTLGGFNGGGNGSVSSLNSGLGGGGGTDIRLNGNALTDRILVAGGGGGVGALTTYNPIGGGGGGGTACSSPLGVGGAGGSGCSGVNGGNGGCAGSTSGTGYGTGGSGGGLSSGGGTSGSGTGGFGSPGALGVGGAAGGYTIGTSADGAGGGGGGYYGGAGGMSGSGGCNGGGGGGSSYANSSLFSSVTFSGSARSGNGYVVITYGFNGSGVSVTSPSLAICAGQSSALNGAGVVTYTWLPVGSFAGANTQNISVNPTTTTTYSVNGTNSLGCISNAAITVTVNSGTPTLSIVSTTNSACLGQSVTLTASGALTYTWSNNVSNGVSFYPNATTTYTIVGGNGCGTSSAVTTVTVAMLPINIAASSTLICSGSAATLAATGANTYTWMPGSFYQATYVPSPTSTTAYTVTGQTGACQGVATVNIVTKAVPSISISVSNTMVCSGDNVTLNALGNALTYTWTPVNQVGNSITVSPANTAPYTVTGTNSLNCTSSVSQIIVVTPNPTINVSSSVSEACPGGTVVLSASGAATYTWTDSGTVSSTVVVNPTASTVYSVTGSYASGCSSSTVISISVFQPTVSVVSTTAVCTGSNVIITAEQAETYSWSTGSTGPSINVTPSANTTYTVTGFSTSPYGLVCADTAVVHVTINPLPVITATADNATICIGRSTSLTATGAVTYTWTGGLGNTGVISVSPVADQTFSVSGRDANGCKGNGSVRVSVSPCTGINTLSANAVNMLIYPNPSNGEFTISADQAITLSVMNELGQQVKTITLGSATPAVKVSNLASGVYFITGANENGSVKQKIVITK